MNHRASAAGDAGPAAFPRGMRLRETGGCYETGCSSAFGPSPWRCRHSLADARSASERRRPPPWAGGTSNASFGNARVIPRGVARGPSLRVRVGPSLSLRLWPSLRQGLARFGLAQRGGRGGILRRTDYYRHRRSCWWYRHYDPSDMPSRCGTYSYAPAYVYSDMGMMDRMFTAQAITAATATLAGMASMAGIASMAARHAASRARIRARLARRISVPELAARMSPGWEPPTSPEASTAAWAAPTTAASGSAYTKVAGPGKVLGERVPRPPFYWAKSGSSSGFG